MTTERFRAFSGTATYAEAEAAYGNGGLSDDQWMAYQNAWALGAPRYSAFGERLRSRVRSLLVIALARQATP